MYFKKLQIVGFKSFADKTEFLFEPGVTAIVGPNGCGKSNLSDAIKWVLGEQSAKELRGSRMEDVIFNGAGSRPPIGMAEVSLTLSNESKFLPVDYSEVTITRRLFRSGDSEYLLNGAPVRLRDITELLLGTGIGTSAYSVIEQGRIDQVLSARPEDRREIFEEASGISKFKAQKREACRKLEQTEENLLRLVDILTEVKRQLAAVDRQAQRAERYRTQWDQLREQEVRLAKRQDWLLRAEEGALAARRQALTDDEAALLDRREASNRSLEVLRQEREMIETAYQAAEVEVSSIVGRREQMADQRRWSEERVAESQARCTAVEHELAELEQRIRSHDERLRQCAAERGQLVGDEQRQRTVVDERRVEMEQIAGVIREAEDHLRAAKMEAFEAKNRQAKCRNTLTDVVVATQTLQARLRRLELERGDVQREREVAHEAMRCSAEELEQLKASLQEVERRRATLATQADAAEQERGELERRFAERTQERQTLQARLETLEDLRRRHEGLSQGARHLLEAGLPGVCGAVAELCEVRGDAERAVERALGDRLHAVVVETDAVALDALRYLGERGLGTATVISLERLQRVVSGWGDEVVPAGGHVRRLRDVVTVPDRYRAVLRWLLADTFVVEQMAQAVELCGSLLAAQPGSAVLTPRGELVDLGSLSGGSVEAPDETMVLGRDRRIRDLAAQLDRVAESCGEIEAELAAAAERRQALLVERSHLDEVRHMTEVKRAELTSRHDGVLAQERQFVDELSTLAAELQELAADQTELQQRQTTLEAELAVVAQQETDQHQAIAQAQTLIEAQQQRRETVRVELAQLEAASMALADQLAQLAKTENVLQESLTTDRQRVEQEGVQIEAERLKQHRLSEDLARLEREMGLLQQQQVVAETQRSEVEQRRAEHAQRFDQAQALLRQVSEQVDEIREIRHHAEVLQSTLDARRQQVVERIRLTYQLELEQADAQPTADGEVVEVAASVERLRAKLTSMGPVNLVAIEERQTLQERLSFLTTQHDDLERSKADLHRAITEINKTTRTLFRETFDRIAAEFQRYYQMLFGGGEARLVLVNQDDVLESGIDVVVSPPGKRLQQLTLLSGGEKAMTAIALLFAIFRVKPSPFCILDEIDAALDEANVARFSRVLEEFVQGSQFIIVTHNKKTIGSADVLYGITMAERGVSRAVSVRMAPQAEAVAAG